jgi:hypothetical protein
MGPKITTSHDFAVELKDYVSQNALRGKELKSLAKSIEYPLSIFKYDNRGMLTNELVFLNTFLGTVTLKRCFSEHPEISQDVVDDIIEKYTKNLLNQWLPDFMLSDYQRRLDIWAGLFREFDNVDQYQKDISKLATSFYESLVKTPCDHQKELMLTMRFNGYMKLFTGSINVMIEDFSL